MTSLSIRQLVDDARRANISSFAPSRAVSLNVPVGGEKDGLSALDHYLDRPAARLGLHDRDRHFHEGSFSFLDDEIDTLHCGRTLALEVEALRLAAEAGMGWPSSMQMFELYGSAISELKAQSSNVDEPAKPSGKTKSLRIKKVAR